MAAIGTDIFFATLPELNAALKAEEFSAVDLARAFSERLEQLGPRYNALALPLPQEALRQAKRGRQGTQARPLSRPAARHSLRRQGSAQPTPDSPPPGAPSPMPARSSITTPR